MPAACLPCNGRTARRGSPGLRGRVQRGLATLATVLALLALAAWSTAFAQRAILHELRATASHLRAAEAFEAAQGGLEWALALLQAGPLDAACLPASAPQPSLAERLALGPVEAACHRTAAGWSCQCPPAGAAAHEGSVANGPPAFRIVALQADPAGVVQLRATGHGTGGVGHASVSMLAAPVTAPAPGASPAVWRRVPGSWRDF